MEAVSVTYTPHTPEDVAAMLAAIGVERVDELFADVPESVRLRRPLEVEGPMGEAEVYRFFRSLAAQNRTVHDLVHFVGAGAYEHAIPAVVQALISRGEFLTAYTPYQAEASQGNLQAIFEFQTMIAELTGLDVVQASLYDGATAAAEAMLLAARVTKRRRVLVSRALHPDVRDVLRTYATGPGLVVEEVPFDARTGATDAAALADRLGEDVAAVFVQYPNFFGVVEPLDVLFASAGELGALAVAVANPLALGLLAPPGALGADVVVGDAQPLGVPLSFGGPYVGYMAAREAYVRELPGRIVGETTDNQGRRGYVLTLQAREQHIRRERATSNITSNQALMALAVTITLSLLGKRGIGDLARLNAQKARYTLQTIEARTPFRRVHAGPFFHEFLLDVGVPAKEILARMCERGFVAGYDVSRRYPEYPTHLLVAVTEVRTREEIERFAEALAQAVRGS
ncbi:MAG: Glycine dehydrogenase [decarboxylating] (glycine cleavage system P1 protein) [Brockia lithotrophica]|uniref:Probable glycine dehydrogenase (decarboxylating) subunit 1 n=1 Tax=Brockia lithotrophica TaxID=933949 RepID=A0A2T5G691_9BACL|nr:MAG: Glycine dehydrogenase [decarboxylating] (glycine cleavage system P1 protein) [Brockia lithotrophica]